MRPVESVTSDKEEAEEKKNIQALTSQPYYCPLAMVRQDDEISFADFWRILVRRRRIIIVSTAVALSCAILYLFFAKQVYESRVGVVVGMVGQVGQVEDVSELQQRMMRKYPSVLSVETNKKQAPNTVFLTLQGPSWADVDQGLQRIVKLLLLEHEEIWLAAVVKLQQKHDGLVEEINELEAQRLELLKLVQRNKKNDPALVALLTLASKNLMKEIEQKKEKTLALREAVINPQAAQSKRIGEYVTPASPVKPRKMLVLSLSIVLGAILGGIFAFCIDSIEQQRK